MDDLIIYSWCFHDVECFDSTPSAAIIILDKDLESFSSLRSQKVYLSLVRARQQPPLDPPGASLAAITMRPRVSPVGEKTNLRSEFRERIKHSRV